MMENRDGCSLLVIIPAYNEEQNIVSVMEDLKKNCPQYDCLIVNDGSTDRTLEICRKNHYQVLNLPVNLNLAGAFQGGVRYAVRKGYRYVLQFDGDGQHKAEYISDMLTAARAGQCNIVIGSRYIQGKKGWTLREAGSRIISLCIWLTTGKRIQDPTSGMRLFDAAMMEKLAFQMNHDPEPDTLAVLLKKGAVCREVPVKMQERLYGASYLTFSNSVKYMFYMCMSILVLNWLR